MDHVAPSIPTQSSVSTESSQYMPTTIFNEVGASTRSYPAWWADLDSRRTVHRRMSVGQGVLDRNLTFVDTPGLEDDDQIQQIFNHVNLALRRTAHLESWSDSEIIGLLSGDGGVQIDAVVYLFEPTASSDQEDHLPHFSAAHAELLQYLGRWTNFIPVVAQADTLSPEALIDRKLQITDLLDRLRVPQFELQGVVSDDQAHTWPWGISSAPGDDTDEVDASVLMSSQYLLPLAPSELGLLVDTLLEPSNIARLRHISATKFLLWRQQNVDVQVNAPSTSHLQSPRLGYHSRVTSVGSLMDDPSQVLVPHHSPTYYRSASPVISDISGQIGQGIGASTQALARYNEQIHAQQPPEPFRQVRLAEWAQDLQRSLNNERRKYEPIYTIHATRWPAEDSEKNDQALVTAHPENRSSRGRLGGEISVFDPRDPLGVLAFGQTLRDRGLFLLQVISGAGLVGAAAFGVARNWMEIQSFLGWSPPSGMVTTTAIPPPPPAKSVGCLDEEYLRGVFAWLR